MSEEVESGSAIHLAFDHLMGLTLPSTGRTVGQGEASGDGGQVPSHALAKVRSSGSPSRSTRASQVGNERLTLSRYSSAAGKEYSALIGSTRTLTTLGPGEWRCEYPRQARCSSSSKCTGHSESRRRL